jgi:3-oxoacyl-[acyl-carrier-protein] synthase-3
MPPNACLLQHRLALPRSIAALDYTLACSGFVYGLFLANSLVRSGSADHVLLVTAETYSKLSHPDDRGTRTLFGDGAAAAVISTGETGLDHFLLGTDGGVATAFYVPAGGARTPRSPETVQVVVDRNGNARSAEQICMNGAAVMDFVKKEIPRFVRTLLERANLRMEDMDLVIFHQASKVTLDYLNGALHVPEKKRFSNIAEIGNTVSPSLPIALRQAELQGILQPGMRVLIAGFGVGFSWGGCIIQWHPEKRQA